MAHRDVTAKDARREVQKGDAFYPCSKSLGDSANIPTLLSPRLERRYDLRLILEVPYALGFNVGIQDLGVQSVS